MCSFYCASPCFIPGPVLGLKGDDSNGELILGGAHAILRHSCRQYVASIDLIPHITQWCRFLNQEVPEKRRDLVAPPRGLPLSVCASRNS